MSISTAFNPPQFEDEYDGLKMRQLIDELTRLYAEFVRTFDWFLANQEALQWEDDDGVKQDFIALGGGASTGEVEHHTFFQEGAVTTTSDTYVNVTGATFADSNLESGKDYILLVRAIGESTETASGGNGIRVAIGGSGVLISEKHYESPNGTPGADGHPYYFAGRITAGSGDITVQHKSSHATRTHSTSWVGILLIKVDDLTEGTNIITATTNADPGVALNNSSFTSFGAPITFGDGASDWLLIGGLKLDNFASGSSIQTEVELYDGSSGTRVCTIANDDIGDSQVIGWSRIYSGIASTAFNMQGKVSAFTGESVYTFMCAIRLNAFAEYFFNQDLGPTTAPNNDPIDVATIAETAGITSSNWGFFGASAQKAGSSTRIDVGEILVDVNGAGDAELGNPSDYVYVTHSAINEYISTLLFTTDQTISSGETIDADTNVVPRGTAANVRFENSFVLAFTWDLVLGECFEVGNASFPTCMLGSSHRFFDTSGVDYVQFEHDGTDFNISGFQTADVNITDITAINAGTVDVDWNDITATSYGAILEANLVDKIVDEIVTGKWSFQNAGGIVILDAGGTDSLTISHDGTDINLAAASTADMNITGITGFNVVNYKFDVDQTIGAGQDNYILTYDDAGGLISLEVALPEINDLTAAVTWANIPDANVPESAVTQHEAALTVLESQIADGSLLARLAANETVVGDWEHTGMLIVAAGAEATPPLYFTGDPNTGIYAPGADIFAITVGAEEAVRYTEVSSHVLAEHSMETGITASTTQAQGERPLLSSYNEISVCANNDDVVTMPAANEGRLCLVINRGAKRLQLFPASGDDLGQGVDTSDTVKVNTSMLFIAFDGTTWHEVA